MDIATRQTAQGVWQTLVCNGCHGGQRVKWSLFVHNREPLHNKLHQEWFQHAHALGYDVEEDEETGKLYFDTAKEAARTWMCRKRRGSRRSHCA